jgi:dipeptidyl aminopeptidase/acylaminoacyl peptidase
MSGAVMGVSRRRAIGVAVGIVLLVLVGGYLYVGSRIYDTISIVPSNCGGEFATNTPFAYSVEGVDTSQYLMPTYEEVTLPSRDPEVEINAWYVPPDDASSKDAVVIVHGRASCKRSPRILFAAGMLHRDGIAVLMIDLRNHGDSTVTNGRYAGGTREYRDALGGWDWLVNVRGFDADRVGLLGQSLGAATALIAMGEEPQVPATWEDSSYADFDEAVQGELARNGYPAFLRFGGYLVARVEVGDDLTSLSPIDAVAKLDGRPIFITHGDADGRVSVKFAFDLADGVRANGGTVDPWIVTGAGHVQAIELEPAEYERRLDAFFESALAGASG